MRLDKFLVHVGYASRSEGAKLIRSGCVFVDGTVCKSPSDHIDPESQEISVRGEVLSYQRFTYLMLNKPAGYISATDDPRQKTVLELLPETQQRLGLFPCGRLDRDTVGLLILTNDGDLAHRLLSPKHHVAKSYFFHCSHPLLQREIERLEQGVTLEDGYQTLPCQVNMETPTQGIITVTEGKFHQIKRMLQACGNQITYLKRVTFGEIPLDASLEEGQWRPLTQSEIDQLQSHK